MNKEVFQSLPTFETERLRIRPFAKSDFEDYVNWHDTADIIYYCEGLYNFKSDDAQGFEKFFLQRVPRMFKTKESGIWCIADKSSDKSIGLIEVCKFDAYANTAQIHYSMGQATRCKGYMTEAVRCMLEWAFNVVDLNRIYTFVAEENTASSKVLIKSGFKLEGIMRQAGANRYTSSGGEIRDTKKDARFISEKKFRDDCIYAILKQEYVNIV